MGKQKRTIFLGEMTRPDIEEYLKESEKKIIIVPTGSTEQHGPHLSINTDAFIATEISRRVAKEIGALVAPPVYYGFSHHHLGFAGTVTLSPETYISLIKDIYRGFAMMGFKNIIFLNGHGGNTPGLSMSVAESYREVPSDVHVFQTSWFTAIPAEVRYKYEEQTYGMAHAGQAETELMLVIHPEFVRMDRAVDSWPWEGRWPVESRGGCLDMVLSRAGSFKKITKHGNVGDATKANKEHAVEFLDVIVDYIVKLFRAMM